MKHTTPSPQQPSPSTRGCKVDNELVQLERVAVLFPGTQCSTGTGGLELAHNGFADDLYTQPTPPRWRHGASTYLAATGAIDNHTE